MPHPTTRCIVHEFAAIEIDRCCREKARQARNPNDLPTLSRAYNARVDSFLAFTTATQVCTHRTSTYVGLGASILHPRNEQSWAVVVQAPPCDRATCPTIGLNATCCEASMSMSLRCDGAHYALTFPDCSFLRDTFSKVFASALRSRRRSLAASLIQALDESLDVTTRMPTRPHLVQDARAHTKSSNPTPPGGSCPPTEHLSARAPRSSAPSQDTTLDNTARLPNRVR